MTIRDLDSYELIEEREILDVKSTSYILKHKKSGARIALLSNEDENKVFYIGFRTTPEDETGVPHIIEHSTLCGSEKFPVKDPFIELAKGSLNTFLNAITYPDKTVYPIASCNNQDFKNLMDVYLDAVFHPNITKYEEIFKQEGWHYELESEEDEIKINGVVYNEMKGAYSSPDEVLQNAIFSSLFPNNTYSKDSGGNPIYIPDLTYEAFLAFYHKYYHPSNSYIYLYGNIDMVERLQWLDKEYLSKFEYLKVDSEIKSESAFNEIKETVEEYSIASDDVVENKTYLAYTRVVEDSLDKELYIAFDVLDYALVSAPGAPIRQSLIDAGIGEDVYGSFDSGIKQPVFSIVAKNANECDKAKFLEIIETQLNNIVENGINTDSILAGLNSLEFRFREADFGQFPKGLLYGLQCMDSWLFDDKCPFLHLECLETYSKLKEMVNEGYFEKLIKEYLLENKHGSTIIIKPSKEKSSREEKTLKEKLKKYKESLTKEEIQKLVEDTMLLKKYQEEPSSEENLQKLPMLTREDIKKEITKLSNIETEVDGVKVVRHDISSNGINYLSFIFDANDTQQEDINYLGLLAQILGNVDTENYKYADLSNMINMYTGGINLGTSLYHDLQEVDRIMIKYEARIKVLGENLNKALDLLNEIVNLSDFTNVKRLSEIVTQTKSRLQVALSSAGHTVASIRSLAGTSKYSYIQDALHGVSYYRFICKIEELLKINPDEVISKISKMVKKIFVKDRLMISFTSEEVEYNKAVPLLEKYLMTLPKYSERDADFKVELVKRREGFTDASQIQYVARTGNFRKNGYKYTGALKLLKVILGYDFLWINVRVKGGAYGCMNAFSRTGESYFVSYRDPNLEKTNNIYDEIPTYIRELELTERDMTKYIIGTFSNIDMPLNPEAKGTRSMTAYIEGIDNEMLQKERDEVLYATPEDLRELADLVESVLNENNVCVIGNENMVREAHGLFDSIDKLI